MIEVGEQPTGDAPRQEPGELHELHNLHNLHIAPQHTTLHASTANQHPLHEPTQHSITPTTNQPINASAGTSIDDPQDNYRWGDRLLPKTKSDMRIGFVNINGFPINPRELKSYAIKDFVQKNNLDIVGISECNLHWKAVPSDARLEERTTGWFTARKFTTAYFENQPRARHDDQTQAGGVSQWTVEDMSTRLVNTGIDSSGLGRWAWQRIQGRQGVATRIITAYRPVVGKYPGSVAAQQQAHFDKVGREGDPRDIFTDDLCTDIKSWQEQGDQIVLILDANENVTRGKFVDRLRTVGIFEMITRKHGAEGPATFHEGSEPIDGIFVSPTLLNCRCGYIRGVSDHLGLWADIPFEMALGHEVTKLSKPTPRRLVGNDPRVVTKYNTVLEECCISKHIFERADRLTSQIEGALTKQQTRELESIDRLMISAMKTAERQCRNLHTGEISWTPQLTILRMTEKAWVLKLRGNTGGGRKGYFRRTCRAAGIEIKKETTPDEAKVQLSLVQTLLKQYKAAHEKKRSNWLEEVALAWAQREEDKQAKQDEDEDEDDAELRVMAKAAQRCRDLKRHEEQRKSARIIRWANQRQKSTQSVTSVIGPGPNGERVEFTQQEEMEEALLAESKRKVNQAATTPFLVEPLAPLVGPLGISRTARRILAGNPPRNADIDPHAARLMTHLRRATPLVVPTELSIEGHRRGWAKAKERTSSCPRSPHFGHWKAAVHNDRILTLQAQMAWIPYSTGYALKRWRKATGVVIYKKPGNTNLEMMREIVLLGADANMTFKRFGRDIMRHAESHNLVAPEQYGSRKSLSAIEHCLNKRLSFDILRQTRTPGALCSNDAKGCYDRIVHSVASLCLQRVGMPPGPILSMFRSLQNLRHYVRTAHGDSSSFFESNEVHPVAIQGVCQGNGAGPQIWALISTVILNMLRSAGWGASFISPEDEREIQFVGYSFVDDTDLIVANQSKWADAESVIDALQGAMSEWEGGLRATGGALEPAKTFFYLVDFSWKQGKWTYNTTATTTELQIRNLEGDLQAVEQVPVHEARRTLGVLLAPDGNNDAEFLSLKQKAQVWASNVTAHQLSRKYAWQSLQTTITAQLSYPLPATTLSEAQCSEIDSIIRRTAIPLGGAVRTFPLDLAYSSETRQGLGMLGLFDIQGIAGTLAVIKYCNDYLHLVGKQLAISLELLTIEIGHHKQVFELNFKEWGFLATESYVKHVWRFVDSRQITVKGPQRQHIRRVGDRYLMPTLAEANPPAVLLRLNRCRMYLQVLTLAEIVTTDGKEFNDRGWTGVQGDKPGWPNQGVLPPREWTLWRDAIRRAFGNANDKSSRTLETPLGDWTTEQPHRWWYNQDFRKIYKQTDHVTAFTAIEQRARRSQEGSFIRTGREQFVPAGSLPATVHKSGETMILRGYSHQRLPIPISSDEWWGARQQRNPSDDGDSIIAKIEQGIAKAVADGSFKDGWGTASGIVTGSSPTNDLTIDVITPGQAKDQCSFRSELAGLLAIIRSVNELVGHHGLTTGSITVACDNESAVRAANNKTGGTNPNASHFDLVTAVRQHILRSPIQWLFIHVQGHATGSLNTWEQLNHNMDAACKLYWKQTEQHRAIVQDFEPKEWSVWLGQKKVTSAARTTLREWVQQNRADKYWNRRLSQEANEGIDWDATAAMMKRIPPSRRMWLSKQSSSMFATGERMLGREGRTSNRCPCCPEVETADHILRCQQPASVALWNSQVDLIKEWMQEENTDPEISDTLFEGLIAWRQLSTEEATRYKVNKADLPESLRQIGDRSPIATAQNAIGWRSAIEGRLAIQWRDQQEQFWAKQNRKKSSRKWAATLTTKLINLAWELWQHRNNTLHRSECREADEVLDAKVTNLYGKGPANLPPVTQRLFLSPLNEILQRRPQQKLDWVTSVEAATTKFARQSQRLRGSRQIMEAFIRNAQNPPTPNTIAPPPTTTIQTQQPSDEAPTATTTQPPTPPNLFPIFHPRPRRDQSPAQQTDTSPHHPTLEVPVYPIFRQRQPPKTTPEPTNPSAHAESPPTTQPTEPSDPTTRRLPTTKK
jgi:Reverse transcriptase (RNA-dependent DNA polymerase)